ncbi:hypothetical protein BS78_05G188500 [Paspalum vaginatum]|nr:hypothetical protein BS78_05G188500 [Paspalum vaginatum]
MAINIKLYELIKITDDFSDDRKVGSGGYGDVYKAVYRGEKIAVKLLNSTKEGIDDEQFKKELENHMKAQHPNIIRLVGYCNDERKVYIERKDGLSVFGRQIFRVLCFEYMPGGSLHTHISENSLGDEWRTHYNIIKGICEGLHHLHCGGKRPILHLDLKPANILLDMNMVPKLADFGLSRIYTSNLTHVPVDSPAGTWRYMAPELLKPGGELSAMADIFSLGVTIIDVIKGSQDFGDYDDNGTAEFIAKVPTQYCHDVKTVF